MLILSFQLVLSVWIAFFIALLIVGALSFVPSIGLVLLIVSIPSYIIKVSLLSIPTNLFEIIVGASFVFTLLARKITWSMFKPLWLPTILLFIGAISGVFVAVNRVSALGILKGWFLIPVLLAIVVASIREEVKTETPILVGLALSAFFWLGLALTQIVTGRATQDWMHVAKVTGFLNSANYLALYLIPLGLLLTGWFVQSSRSFLRLGMLLMSVFIFFISFLTFSKGGWFALLIGLLIIAASFSRKLLTLSLGALAVIALILFFSVPAVHLKVTSAFQYKKSNTTKARLQIFTTSLKMLRNHPLLGIGLGSYEKLYPHYAPSNALEKDVLHSHNVFLMFWLSTGFLGLLAFIWLVALFSKATYARFVFDKRYIGPLAAMVAILVHGLVDTSYFKNDLAALFWLVMIFML